MPSPTPRRASWRTLPPPEMSETEALQAVRVSIQIVTSQLRARQAKDQSTDDGDHETSVTLSPAIAARAWGQHLRSRGTQLLHSARTLSRLVTQDPAIAILLTLGLGIAAGLLLLLKLILS